MQYRLLEIVPQRALIQLVALPLWAARPSFESMADRDAIVHLQVFESPGNPWGGLSMGAWVTLRQPVCMVLLRSATVNDESSFAHAPRLFAAVLCRTPLKHSLKAELGAFFPLLLHKPLELDAAPAASVASALEASARIAADAQLLVDLFVNYDCDLQAVNIFERWMHGLQRIAGGGDGAGSERAASLRVAAVSCVCTMLRSLDAWVAKLDGVAEPRVAEMAPSGTAGTPEGTSNTERDIEVRPTSSFRSTCPVCCTPNRTCRCTPTRLSRATCPSSLVPTA
jgi:hypothetical protein